MANKIKLTRGTKANIEANKSSLEPYQIVYATDTSEIGVKKANGNVDYFPDTARLENTASKLYGANNLAVPDLEGKEYLGDGVYRLYNSNGFTFDYNIYDGVYNINGSTTESFYYTLFNLEQNTEYTLSYVAVSGTMSGISYLSIVASTPGLLIINQVYQNVNKQNSFTTTTQDRLALITDSGRTFNNYQFKLQLEKGDTATPYTVPAPFLLPNDIPEWAKTEPPSALRYMQMNANNTVTWRTAAQLRGDIGAATPANITTAVSTHNESPTAHTDIRNSISNKQDKLVAGDSITIDENNVIEVDLNAMSYFDYASSIYGDKYSLLKNAWEHSLTVDQLEISADSTQEDQRGKAQYPNGETEGVIIPHGVTSIGNSAFFNWSSNNQPLVIPNSVTSIGEAAFQNWTSNNQILVIPNSVTSISDGTFANWYSNNQLLVIPNSVTIIGNGSFYSWTSNNQPLVIPDSVTSIGDGAFFGWSSVPYVEMKATTPPTISSSSFDSQNNAPIYVPDESVDDYKTANNWVDLADKIFPISDKLTPSGKEFHRVRIFSDTNNKLITTQMVQEGESLKEENKLKNGYLFDYGTRNEFDYNTVITEDFDLTYSIIPPRYVQTTSADFNSSGNYTGTESYIILPADKPDGYRILNPNVKGVATDGDYLTNCYNMFNGNPSLYLELDYLDTSNVISMYNMFLNSQATTLDLSSFDTSNVTYMTNMFYGSQATTLDLSSFDTSKVTDMRNMFRDSQAAELDLTSFDISNVTYMSYMFRGSQATELDLSSFDTSNVTEMRYMFYRSRATTLDLSSFDTSNGPDMHEMFYQSQATTGYARTQADADRFNDEAITLIPSTLTFVVTNDASNIHFNGSGTNYLTTKTQVESAIKELDTRVKTNADYVDTVVDNIVGEVDQNTQQIINNQNNITQLQTGKQDKLVAGDNITINPTTNVISASGGSFYTKSTDIALNNTYSGSHSLQSDTVFVELIAHRSGFVQGTMTFSKASLNIEWMGDFLYPWTGQVNGILNITYGGNNTLDIDWDDGGLGSAAANYLTIIEHRFGDA